MHCGRVVHANAWQTSSSKEVCGVSIEMSGDGDSERIRRACGRRGRRGEKAPLCGPDVDRSHGIDARYCLPCFLVIDSCWLSCLYNLCMSGSMLSWNIDLGSGSCPSSITRFTARLRDSQVILLGTSDPFCPSKRVMLKFSSQWRHLALIPPCLVRS
jgi:hypothetical protein